MNNKQNRNLKKEKEIRTLILPRILNTTEQSFRTIRGILSLCVTMVLH